MTINDDRRQFVLVSHNLNGIDFVRVFGLRPITVEVHFLNQVPLSENMRTAQVRVNDEQGRSLSVQPVDPKVAWGGDAAGRPVLTLQVTAPAEQSRCVLTLSSPKIDPYFSTAIFTFPPDDWGVGATPAVDLQLRDTPPDIDYLAKDFLSFRQALSDFAAARHPAWSERLEADLGVVLLEALSVVADELSYLQDRVAAEAFLFSATQPLSLQRHARLVDHEPLPSVAATVTVQLEVRNPDDSGRPWTLTEPLRCEATDRQGRPIEFTQLPDTTTTGGLRVNSLWNRSRIDPENARVDNLRPYVWDESSCTISRGATQMWLYQERDLGLHAGQRLLVDTDAGPVDDPVREIVTLTADGMPETDLLKKVDLVRIRWTPGLSYDHDLTATRLAGNLVDLRHGRIVSETIEIPTRPDTAETGTIGRVTAANEDVLLRTGDGPPPGSNESDSYSALGQRPVTYRHSLSSALAWSAEQIGKPARPEIRVERADALHGNVRWTYLRSLLSASPTAPVYTVTPERYRVVLVENRGCWLDYDGAGDCIMFGSPPFGAVPEPGARFHATYLSGGGAAGNVPADTVVTVQSPILGHSYGAGTIVSCTNPLAANGGTAAETRTETIERAPMGLHFSQRLVTNSDYQAFVVARRNWVRYAVVRDEWTGSWPTKMVIIDPLTEDHNGDVVELLQLLRQRRLAGADVQLRFARYRSLNLRIAVVALPGFELPTVEASVLDALSPTHSGSDTCFFSRSHWPFGRPLRSATLRGAVQRCTGVAAVQQISWQSTAVGAEWQELSDEPICVGADEILRISDDPWQARGGRIMVRAMRAR